LGCSTRKVAEVLFPILGEKVSPTTVSRVARILDDAVAAFHRRPLRDEYRALALDGVVLSRKTGIGAVKRPVLVALGIRPDGKKEVIDYRMARAESQVAWEFFLNSLYRRGLTGETLEIICVDGGAGLLAALPLVYPDIPVQRCWAHKMRNLTDKVKKIDRDDVKEDLQKIYLAKSAKLARKAAQRVAKRWGKQYPKVISSLRADLDALLNFYVFKDEDWRVMTRTTNAIERCFVEVRRRTRPMGVFSDKTSMDRILYAVFTHLNKNQGISTPFLLTQNS
jgi:transposase-like protein